MTALDWLVIVGYAALMLAIGAFYARRTGSTEEYLLGGRRMNPIAVGLSLFATLMSTLSYLAWPGEMIKHGPMLLGGMLAYPFIALVVGWWLIPYIMRLRITSAYEALETRFGLSTRLVGSSIFLLMRFAWMASILYATSSEVIVPLLGLAEWTVPLVCVALGAATVLYTASGGIRAVVLTDALQSIIMFLGAIVTIVVVSVRLGSATAWWPTEWAPHWQPAAWGFDLTARVSLVGAITSAFTWHVCTAGSDQLAVQRFLATRDIHAARRSMITTYVSDVLITGLLSLVGFAVLGYFTARPAALDGTDLVRSADRLFPLFVLTGLPSGLAGLVMAAILSAAMSSLSSGVNSTCAVIAEDFIARLRPVAGLSARPQNSVRLVRQLSVAVGALAVALSILVSRFEGNLIELCYKVVNLLVAPLFVLFFMAMFVPWATQRGTLIGLAISIIVAVGIGHLQWFGVGFVWMMQASLIAGIAAASLASLVRVGSPRLDERVEGESV
jgi:SSS family solute:Na+ symporter